MKFNFFILLINLSFIFSSSLNIKTFLSFTKFIKKYNKKYTSYQEFLQRYKIFTKNILSQNKIYKKQPITKFYDLTYKEFLSQYTFQDLSFLQNLSKNIIKNTNIPTNKNVPDGFNWKKKGFIPEIRNQGSCKASWACSTISNIEAQYMIKTGRLRRLSEQLLVDCDTYNKGCEEGFPDKALEWLIKNHGIQSIFSYKYVARKEDCKMNPEKFIKDCKVKSFTKLGNCTETFCPVNEEEMKVFLYENGPLIVMLNAKALYAYYEGVIDLSKDDCEILKNNHFAVVTGYGHDADSDLDYWIVLNSWGDDWGENGYFRIARGKGTCGINQYVLTSVLE